MLRSEILMDPRFSLYSMLLLPAQRSPFNRAPDPSPIRFLLGQLLPSPGEDLHMLLMPEIPTPLPGATTAFTQGKKSTLDILCTCRRMLVVELYKSVPEPVPPS
jgi:hypothetical protein